MGFPTLKKSDVSPGKFRYGYPGFANAATLPPPSPSTAPVQSGLVPQCGQEQGTWGDTPKPVALSLSDRRRAVPTSQWPWASDGPSAERRIVGPCRHWRPWGRSVGAGRAGGCCWRIAVGAVQPRGREAVQPGPLVRRQLGGHSGPDRQRRAAASAAGTPSRAQPVSRQKHPRGLPEVCNCTVLPGPQAGRVGQRLRSGCVPACGMPRMLAPRRGQWP